MKHYKDEQNNIFGFMPYQSVPAGLTEISMEEVAAINESKIDKTAAHVAEIDAELREIDLASIRSMREYLAALPDAPQYLKDHESAAAAKRAERPSK